MKFDFNKNTKFKYYITQFIHYIMPNWIYKKKSILLLSNTYSDYIYKRVNYYNNINNHFLLNLNTMSIKNFQKKEKKKTYYFDLLEYLRYFNSNFKISYLFGDITTIPDTPSLLKSRPIEGDNQNSILMKLNKVRHFIFVDDKIRFEDKKDILVWRGKCYVEHRVNFLKQFYDNILCNVGQTNPENNFKNRWQKEKMQLSQQLKYKFILAIEGNDVASNLKWIMSSNSIAFMVKPTYETWFMEGTLIPNYHYVLLEDDYSDLEEKIKYYSTHIEESLSIIKNANEYTKQFQDKKQEDIISLLVLKKYFENSNQL